MRYFITAIGTDSGKTLVSAIFCEALGADYWKPIQAGFPKDSDTVKMLLSTNIRVHPEGYLLNTPASPHAAAKIDGIHITLEEIKIPPSEKIIIEGAGGILVPLNDKDLMIDLMLRLDLEIILVINLYLGCINHSLLTLEVIKARKLKLKGIVFNGNSNPESESIILKYASVPCLLRIPQQNKIDRETISLLAESLKQNLKNEFII